MSVICETCINGSAVGQEFQAYDCPPGWILAGTGDPCTTTDYNPPCGYSSTRVPGKVIVFSEKTKGWVSFRSFTEMQLAISMANDFYTFQQGNLWKHYDETVDRNTFYGIGPDQDTNAESSITVVLNDNPGLIKAFNTLNYEGSQSNIPQFTSVSSLELNLDEFQPATTYNDQEIYNLSSKDGWYVDSIITDKEEGYINEFIEKEGKWFNNINRSIDINLLQADTDDFTFQGIAQVDVVDATAAVVNIGGCMDSTMFNFNPLATIDDGSCIPIILGCMDPNACNYDPLANVDDGSCIYDPIICLTCLDGAPVGNTFNLPTCPEGWILGGPDIQYVDPCEGVIVPTVDCTQCDGGSAISNVFEGTVCPEGWQLAYDLEGVYIDPCGDQAIICERCVNGTAVGQQFFSTTCPPGWILSGTGNPCPEVDCSTCDGGSPISNVFPSTVCPDGWVPTGEDDPCQSTLGNGEDNGELGVDNGETGVDPCAGYPGDNGCCGKCDDPPQTWGACTGWCQQWGDCCNGNSEGDDKGEIVITTKDPNKISPETSEY